MAHYYGHDHEFGEEEKHYTVKHEIEQVVEEPVALTHPYHVVEHQHFVDSDSDSDTDTDDEVVHH